MSFNLNNGIPEGDLPVKSPSGAARVRYVDGDGKSYSSAMPDVIAASALVQDAIAGVVADAESEIGVIVNGMGYLPPVAFASGLNVDSSRFTVSYGGVTYAPVADAIPFTSNGTFNPAQWRVVQGVTAADLADPDVGAGLVAFRQAGAGAVQRTSAAKMRESYSLFDRIPLGEHAAITAGTSTYDATADINAAAAYCEANGLRLHGNPGTYHISGLVTINCDGDLSRCTFNVPAATVPIAVRIGTASGEPARSLNLLAPRVVNTSKTAPGYAGFEDSVGVELANLYESNIVITHIKFFGVGLDCGGYNSGFSYNNVTIQFLETNRVNLRIRAKGPAGWANENNFIGGRFYIQPSQLVGATGTRQILLQAYDLNAAGGPNNNVFTKPSLESNVVEFMLDVMGSWNQFVSPRFEGAAKNVRFYAATSSGTNSNVIIGGYQSDQLAYTFDGPGTSMYNGLLSPRGSYFEGSGVGINMAMGGGTQPHIQGFSAGTRTLSKSLASTDWRYRLTQDGLFGKLAANEFPLVSINFSNGRVSFGSGTTEPGGWFQPVGAPGAIGISATALMPVTTGITDLGSNGFRYRNLYMSGGIGVFGATVPASKPTVSGSRSDGSALASLLTALAAYGFITNSSTA